MHVEKITMFLDKVSTKIDKTSECIGAKFPYTTTNGKYEEFAYNDDIYWWTNGFWPGIMWKMFILTKNEKYRNIAEKCEEKLDAALDGFVGLNHDVGFMWLLSSVANYTLTGNCESKVRGLKAANYLMGRFNLAGSYIRAWISKLSGLVIIDSMMNIPLLSWAAKVDDDPRYVHIAKAHAETICNYWFDTEGASHHICEFNPYTGEYIKNATGQGFDENSAWSRGNAWALYGFALAYSNLGNVEYLDRAKKSAEFFMAHVGEDNMPDSDFRAPSYPVKKDMTAAAIAACGLLEISELVSEGEKEKYLAYADRLIEGMYSNCDFSDEEQSILQNGSLQYHGDFGCHIPIIYGDYFMLEALMKRLGKDKSFWNFKG